MNIKLNLIADIYNFIDVVQKHPSDVKLSQGNYMVDGKSILGVFALNLKESFTCIVEDGNYNDFAVFEEHK